MTNQLVTREELRFHLRVLLGASAGRSEGLWGVHNSALYLSLVAGRMSMDEEEDYWRRPNQFLPTLDYQV